MKLFVELCVGLCHVNEERRGRKTRAMLLLKTLELVHILAHAHRVNVAEGAACGTTQLTSVFVLLYQ